MAPSFKKTCSECPRVANTLIPISYELDGTITYMCSQCCDRLKIKDYLHAKDCPCGHCSEWSSWRHQ